MTPTPKLFDLTGRVALITGGNKGLGRAMAHGFAAAGADVFIASRNEDELKAVAEAVRSATGRKAEYAVTDVSVRDDVKRLARTATERMGQIDILVNNAGMNWPQPIDEITDEAWDRVLEVNLTSVMALTRELVPPMKERRWGRVIHLSSIMGEVSKERRNAYSATKTALRGLARASALDLGPFNVTVNCIAPGPFLTDMPMSVLSDAEKQVFADRTALGRWADPNELVGPAVFLASDAGSYVTGHTLFVDGGYTAR
jgi:NAD(P)-dependent dehydrogenase (short-subunit alcohol dehydrogenase family)